MSLAPGQALLHYRIVDKLGEGGMGQVWKAVDTTLDREVAIKILPAAFADDATRLARFEREAKLLASLNHPNIAGIHGLHEDGGLRFLAMELVPGEDLESRLSRGTIPEVVNNCLADGGEPGIYYGLESELGLTGEQVTSEPEEAAGSTRLPSRSDGRGSPLR